MPRGFKINQKTIYFSDKFNRSSFINFEMPFKNRYFIGIVPPAPIFEQALELKHYFQDHYQSKGSLNSPPHVTLHMPFEWKAEKEEELVNALHHFSVGQPTIKVVLKDFDCFARRVIFINVIPSKDLSALQRSIRLFCKKELGLFNADYKDLPFHPHITVAFRDLKKSMFTQAWEEFKNKRFDGEFLADRVTLLKHVERKWVAEKEFSFINQVAIKP